MSDPTAIEDYVPSLLTDKEKDIEVVQAVLDVYQQWLRQQALNPAEPAFLKDEKTGIIVALEYSRQLEDLIPACITHKPWYDDLTKSYQTIMAQALPLLIEAVPLPNLVIEDSKQLAIVSWLNEQYLSILNGQSPLSQYLALVASEEHAEKLQRVKARLARKEHRHVYCATVGVRLIAQIAATEKAVPLIGQPIKLTLAAQAKLRRYGEDYQDIELLAQENLSYHWTQQPAA